MVAYVPTDLTFAFHTMTLASPNSNWYMDIGATSHMTSTPSNLTSYFNLSNTNGITICNGLTIPICGYGKKIPIFVVMVIHIYLLSQTKQRKVKKIILLKNIFLPIRQKESRDSLTKKKKLKKKQREK